MTPSYNWPGDGMMGLCVPFSQQCFDTVYFLKGVTVRFDSFEDAEEHLVHILVKYVFIVLQPWQ